MSRPRTLAVPRASAVTAPLICFIGGVVLLALAMLLHVAQGETDIAPAAILDAILAFDAGNATHNVVRYLRLPRTMIGLLAGSALGMAGVILQAVTRNPLASPGTLAVNAGAYAAVVVAAVFFPALAGVSAIVLAFIGGLGAVALVYMIASDGSVTPVRLALAGLAVALALSALTAAIQLLYENETAGLFLWGAGTLIQVDWSGSLTTFPRWGVALVAALLVARPLAILQLGDETARALGQNVERVRLLGLLVGVFLAAVAVSAVGPIGFVGLVTPHLVRGMGVRGFIPLLLGAALWGALITVAADIVALMIPSFGVPIPTGAVTALVGAPYLMLLARRAGRGRPGRAGSALPAARHRPAYGVLFGAVGLLFVLLFLAGVGLGYSVFAPAEWLNLLQGQASAFTERVVWLFRVPRLLVAALAGAALAVSGTLLQGVIRNPLAGPELIGISAGAGVGAIGLLILVPSAPAGIVPFASVVGAFLAFALIYRTAWQEGISPEQFALVGVALSAVGSAIISILVIVARMRVAQALVWLSGSTYARGWDEVAMLGAWFTLLLPAAWFAARWLDLLALGDDSARALGVPLERVRGVILSLSVALAAVAVSVVGMMSFIGLVAPHAARLLVGARHRLLVPLAALLGAIVVVVADTVGRTLFAPTEIPSGLVTALLGAPYFLWLLRRRAAA